MVGFLKREVDVVKQRCEPRGERYECLSGGSQAAPSGTAVQESYAERIFELPDAYRHVGLDHVEPACSLRDAADAGYLEEYKEVREQFGVQVRHHLR